MIRLDASFFLTGQNTYLCVTQGDKEPKARVIIIKKVRKMTKLIDRNIFQRLQKLDERVIYRCNVRQSKGKRKGDFACNLKGFSVIYLK